MQGYQIRKGAKQTSTAPHVLIVEDDRIASARIATALSMNGFLVDEVHNIQDAKKMIANARPDHIILDISLPDGSGLEVISDSRDKQIGILCVSANNDTTDRLTALRLGADDYISKPVSSEELILKLNNLHQRIADKAPNAADHRQFLCFGKWKCDMLAQRVYHPNGHQVDLTPGEFAILKVFLNSAKTCLTRDQIMTLAANEDYIANDRSVDIMIHRLRKKLEKEPKQPDLFVTVYGVGYIFPQDVIIQDEDDL